MKKKYIVYGWSDGSDYERHQKPDYTTKVTAENDSEAEDIADKRFKKKYGGCNVIDSELIKE